MAAIRIAQGSNAEASRILADVPASVLAEQKAALHLGQAELAAGRPEQAVERLSVAVEGKAAHRLRLQPGSH